MPVLRVGDKDGDEAEASYGSPTGDGVQQGPPAALLNQRV